MFMTTYHKRVQKRLGAFPTIHALLAIPKRYRTRCGGALEFIRDGLVHFEADEFKDCAWDILEYAYSNFDQVACCDFTRLDAQFPIGYRYLRLFQPEFRNALAEIFGPNPLISHIIRTPPEFRNNSRGCLRQIEGNSFEFIIRGTGRRGWTQIEEQAEWNESYIGM